MSSRPSNQERARRDGHDATLPASPASATTARDLVRRVLPTSASADQRATVELLTTELVTNAIVHARTDCELRLRFPREDVLRVEVTDYADGSPAVQPDEPAELTGRGLQLVAALASQWGTDRTDPTGKTVWFEAPL